MAEEIKIFKEERKQSYYKMIREIMTQELDCLQADDKIITALELFQKNKYHAIPIVKEDDEIVGILTTFDIINLIMEEVKA